MFEAEALDLPFMATMPKREKTKLVRVWELVKEMAALSKTEGQLIPLMMAAKCLGVSRSTIDDLVRMERLKRFDIDGHVFISANSIEECAKVERKVGRPFKVPTNSELWKSSKDSAREMVSKKVQ